MPISLISSGIELLRSSFAKTRGYLSDGINSLLRSRPAFGGGLRGGMIHGAPLSPGNHAFEIVVRQFKRLDQHLVVLRIQRSEFPPDGVGVCEPPSDDGFPCFVQQADL